MPFLAHFISYVKTQGLSSVSNQLPHESRRQQNVCSISFSLWMVDTKKGRWKSPTSAPWLLLPLAALVELGHVLIHQLAVDLGNPVE